MPMNAAWTIAMLLLILRIAPIFFTTIVADDQFENSPARFNHNAWKSLSREPAETSEVQRSKPEDSPRGKDQSYVQRDLRRQRKFDHGSQRVHQALTERFQIPEYWGVGQLNWDQLYVVFNHSALASHATTKFYLDVTNLPIPKQWLVPAVHIFILSCGAIKLTFEIVASERRVSWQTAWAFVLDFLKMMILISRRLALASYRVIVITAFVTYLVTLHIIEHDLQPHLITAPVV